MNDTVDLVLRKLLESSIPSANGQSVEYLGFKCNEDGNWNDGLNASVMFGHIQYRYKPCNNNAMTINGATEKEEAQLWEPMLVKLNPHEINFPQFHVCAFVNEAYFFTRLVPFFERLSPIFRSLFPKMYTSYVEMGETSDNFMLVFEDLKAAGYFPGKLKSFLDLDHLRIMVHRLGQFHSFSYEARRKFGREFQALGSVIAEIHFTAIGKLQRHIPEQALRGYLPLMGDPKYVSKLDKVAQLIPQANEFMRAIMCDEKNAPMSVLCHGDYLQTNVLFKYDENGSDSIKGGKPIDMKMIDMASIKVGSPIIDLSTVLYFHADQSTRTNYWNDLIDEYYQGLCSLFPESVPTKESILEEFHTKAMYAYFFTGFFLPQFMCVDMNEPSIYDLVPPQYRHLTYSTIPEKELSEANMKVGGKRATQAVIDVLKDIIDRGFI